MIQAKCIQKFRDDKGKIYGYRLIDINGQTQDVQSDNLKLAIRNKKIHVVNLTLTTDNRLVDTTEKQLQAKVLGKAPTKPETKNVVKSNNQYHDVAKALVLLDKELLDMGDSYEEVVGNRAYSAGYTELNLYNLEEYYNKPEYKDCTNDYEILDKILYKTYIKLLTSKPNEIDTIILMWDRCDSYSIFEENIKYESVSKITQSKIYQALFIVHKYATEKKLTKVAIRPLGEFLSKIRRTGIAAINLGYEVGHCYYQYLDNKIFGTISNDVFTVGHVIAQPDIREHKEYKGYSYVLHKDINKCGAPKLSLAAFFKNTEGGKVQIIINVGRSGYVGPSHSCVGLIGYIHTLGAFVVEKDIEIDECAHKLANAFNKLAPMLYDMADLYQSLYSNLAYNTPLEKIENLVNTYSNIDMLNMAISRWTKIRGDKTPAKIMGQRSEYNGINKYDIVYLNNISNNGRNCKLHVLYDGETFTINVIENDDINNIVISKSENMTGTIKENSMTISKILAEALISANVKGI